jgi:hypothetical protein
VADYYYEINDCVINEFGGKYFAVHNTIGDAMEAGGYKITAASDRVWKERNGEVWYIKNRTIPHTHAVDLQEFMWIKLKCKQINNIHT